MLNCPDLREGGMAREDMLVMSREELRRLEVIKKVICKEMKQKKAGKYLEMSLRQVKRWVKRVRKEGEKGILHRLRGRSSNRQFEAGFKERVLELMEKKYGGFGPTLAVEKLLERDGIHLSDETLRQWLLDEGEQWEWRRKGRMHREWRERKAQLGEMAQMDGSHHDWLEGRGPWLVLMGYIDDATGRVYGRFYDYEGTLPAMDSLKRYLGKYGIPQSVYLDKHKTYKSGGKLTVEEELAGKENPLSQFERACKELGVRVIHADSPQAKGRIERLFKTFQDRLIKEMRLEGIKGKEEANRFLEKYLPIYSERFGVAARESGDLHRTAPKDMELRRILCIQHERVLRNDWTVEHENKLYQVLDSIRTKRVRVEQRIDGTMRLYAGEKRLRFREIVERPQRRQKLKLSEWPLLIRRKVHIPAANHPWRRYQKPMAVQSSAQD
jgi:transposase